MRSCWCYWNDRICTIIYKISIKNTIQLIWVIIFEILFCFCVIWWGNSRGNSLRALFTGRLIRSKLRDTLHPEEKRVSGTLPANVDSGSKMMTPPSSERRFSRLFSLRRSITSLPIESLSSGYSMATPSIDLNKSSATISPASGVGSHPLPQLLEEEEMMTGLGYSAVSRFRRRHQPMPALPPMPPNLDGEQIKRRYIVANIINSENAYVSALHRLINVSCHSNFIHFSFLIVRYFAVALPLLYRP